MPTHEVARAAPASATRVLLFHPALAPYRVDMFNALAKRCTLELVFLEANVQNQSFDQAKLRGMLEVEPRYLLDGLSIGGRSLRLGIDRSIRRFRPDVVITSEFGLATASVIASRALRRSTFPLVVSTEDNPSSVENDTRLHALGRRALLPHVDAVLTYSQEARELYVRRFRASQPIVASALVQSEVVIRRRLEQAGPAAAELARTGGLVGKRVLLYVGRLAREKRVDRLVDCFTGVRAAVPDAILALVGDGPEREALATRAAAGVADGSVRFVGRLEGEALAAWYRAGSVFALASEHEPFGAVVNEALLAGMPVVCSDRAGARVLVGEGRNGAVVDAGQPAALTDALIAWLQRQPALAVEDLQQTRPSLMETTFDDALTAYLAALDAARRHRARDG